MTKRAGQILLQEFSTCVCVDKAERENKTVFKTLLKTIVTTFSVVGAVVPHP